MKTTLSFLLSALLIITVSGCSSQEMPDTEAESPSQAETEAEISAVTEVPASLEKIYPPAMATAILVEGEPEKLMMDLFDGGNYVIYIPQNDWTLETSLKDGLLTDRWSCAWADEVFLEVVSCGTMTEEEVKDHFRETYPDDTFEEAEPGGFYIRDSDFKCFRSLTVFSEDAGTFAILTEMPVEFGDGFSPRFGAMVNSFEIKE